MKNNKLIIDSNQDYNYKEITEALKSQFEIVVQKGNIDYEIDNLVIEMKTPSDFWHSIIDRRIWKQAEYSLNFRIKILMILTSEVEFWKTLIFNDKRKKLNIRHIIENVLNILSYKFGFQILFLEKEIIIKKLIAIISVAEREGGERPVAKMKVLSQSDILENMLVQIPGVSLKRARLLLHKFNNLESLLLANEESLSEIKGIGYKLSNNIVNVLHFKYHV